jgi:monoamine oxidase
VLAQVLAAQIRTRMYLRAIQARGNGSPAVLPGRVVDANLVVAAIPFTVLRHVDLRVPLPNRLGR